MKKIVVTGGHLTPALALIEEIKKDREKWQIFYFGVKHSFEGSKKYSFEYLELKNHPTIKFIPIITGRLQRKFTPYTIPSLLKIPLGLVISFFQLLRIRPKIIVSFGGYISLPVVVSGWILGIPSVTHEQTSCLGLANKINSLFVKKIALSFLDKKQETNGKTVVVGNPVLKNIFGQEVKPKSEIAQIISKTDKPIVFICGGKTGSKTINEVVDQAKEKLKETFFIIHQTGIGKKEREPGYYPIEFISSNLFPFVLKKSAIIVSRSGANIIQYLACLEKKAVLIPIPETSENEQEKNAQFLSSIGLAKIIPQEELTKEKLIKTVCEFYREKRKIVYPDWWQEVDPRRASSKLWQLVKDEI